MCVSLFIIRWVNQSKISIRKVAELDAMIKHRIVFFSFGKKSVDDRLNFVSLKKKKNINFSFGDVFRLAPMAYADKSGNGLQNLYSMISYCLNESLCRRKLIASHFDEVWQINDCNEMCDICARPSTFIQSRDCREEAVLIIDYLQQNSCQRLTALKIIEQVSIKTMIKIDVQRLILKLLIEQYLKEDFRFTAYTTICYIVPGPKANQIRNSNCQILLDMIASTKKRAGTKKSTRTNDQTEVNTINGNCFSFIFHPHRYCFLFRISYETSMGRPTEHNDESNKIKTKETSDRIGRRRRRKRTSS